VNKPWRYVGVRL